MSDGSSGMVGSTLPHLSASRSRRRVALMAVLLALYAALSVFFMQALGDREVHAHFAYLPLVLAGLWWGRRGVVVALLLTVVHLGFRAAGLAAINWWADGEFVFSFLLLGFFFGELGERTRRGQRALWASRQRYGQLTEKSLAGIFLYRDEVVVFANARLAAMLGYEVDGLLGRSIWDLVAPSARDEVRERVRQRERNGFSDLHYETRFVRSDGSELWVDIFSTRTTIEGETSVLVNIYDVSARKAAEEKEKELEALARKQEEQLVHSARLAELGELAASVAHEVNQPLTGIRNYARNAAFMLEHGVGGPGAVADNLERIAAQVDRAAYIVRRMQELGRRSDRVLRPYDVNRAVAETLDLLSSKLRLAGVEVTLDLDPGLPTLAGDRIRVEQVFLNLANNALHALEQVSDRRLVVRSGRDGDEMVFVEFEDSGVGFSEEVRQQLFRPFFSTHSNGKGTGLGLSISRSVVEGHGGTIEAVGEPGRGATFTVRLPVVPPAEGAGPAVAGSSAGESR